MIDLHCHILPGIDDGAPDLSVSIEMARSFVVDGVTVVACTPHILPGLYHNSGPQIRAATEHLQQVLNSQGVALRLVPGADNHIVPGFVSQLASGHLLPLADSRYVLVEPPNHVAPPRLEEAFFELVVAGFVPILTHPERLEWLKLQYPMVQRLVRGGVWMQITAGSLVGTFGRTARYWGERLLEEGCIHIIATDAHDVTRRPPNLGQGYECAARRVGGVEAQHMVLTRPAGVIRNVAPQSLPIPEVTAFEPTLSYTERSTLSGSGDVQNARSRTDDGAIGGLVGRLRHLFK
jgi:protein-tyrosine phosphatase